eukprot:9112546-Pyramimonas_sp.AAC.1
MTAASEGSATNGSSDPRSARRSSSRATEAKAIFTLTASARRHGRAGRATRKAISPNCPNNDARLRA